MLKNCCNANVVPEFFFKPELKPARATSHFIFFYYFGFGFDLLIYFKNIYIFFSIIVVNYQSTLKHTKILPMNDPPLAIFLF